MPSASDILLGLTSIANQWRPLAIAWHVVAVGSMLALIAGWRPSTRTAAYALISPLLSVAVAALAFGNMVNGTVFAALALRLGWVARRFSGDPVRTPSPFIVRAAALFIAFGWVYPHFLETNDWTDYAYAAPVGLLPCPTLSLTTGLSMACGQFGSRAWASTLAAAGLVYGAIGVLVLRVTLDVILLGAALAAIATVDRPIQHETIAGGAT